MDKNNRPHGREKEVAEGTAHTQKGEQVNSGGPVGGGQRPGEGGNRVPGGQTPVSNSARPVFDPRKVASATARRPVSGAAGGLSLKRILIIALVVIIGLYLLRSCMGGAEYEDPYYSGSSSAVTGQTGAAPAPTLAPAPTPAPTQTPVATPAPTQAPVTAASAGRAKRVTPLGNGSDVVTVMVYMCGTDLESQYGMGTSDLLEMAKASISDRVNLIVETGGCKRWKNDIVSNSVNQIYQVKSGGLVKLVENAGTAAMTDPENLTAFIQYCAKNFPASRNVLIFWDHGGGSLTGYGYDEKNSGSSSMTLAKINDALSRAGCVFDWIGFDACLMATLETALVCNEYADYMIASEESEPGTGWDYTGWLNALSANTSIATPTLAVKLIDDFVSASTAASPRAQVTLSLIDLAELQGTVPAAFRDFSTSTTALLSGNYSQVSNARSGVRQFAQSSRINQVDLIDLADRLGTPEAQALAGALRSCVKYNKTTISRAYGVSIYFPYESLSSVKSAISTYNSIGLDAEYTRCIQSFASLGQGGQMAGAASQYPSYSSILGGGGSGGDLLSGLLNAYAGSSSYGSSPSYGSYGGSSYASTSPLGSLLGSYMGSGGSSSAGYSLDPATVMSLMSAFGGRSMPQELDWVDTELVAASADTFAANYIDPGRICVTEKDGHRVLELTDEEWALIQTVELNVFYDDGEGYIDLGLDNSFDWYGDDLLLDFDGTWLTLNGQTVSYYLVSDTENDDGSYTTVGRVPAVLRREGNEEQLVNLQVVFEGARGVVTGAYPFYDDGTETLSKGDIPLVQGDVLQVLCDYYGYDGSYSASYTLGDPITVGSTALELVNMSLGDMPCSVTYRLTDIYGNHYWTPAYIQ